MPRPRKNASSPQLSPGQASYVIDRLIRERRVSSGDVSRYLDEMRGEITDLEARLNRLREAHGGMGGGSSSSSSGSSASSGAASGGARRRPGRPPGSGAGRPGRPPGRRPGRPAKAAAAPAAPQGGGNAGNEGGSAKAGAGRKGRKRSAITPEQLASRQLQGRYLALVRQFPENKRSQFARTAKEKGREAAIREMQDSLKK
ncbi:MAG TPA: hypothetical protein VFN10_18960 [Thermoanaerobaculia bacterium]|nr:hypothetical protein [Thermoanaerobaculia bacterium]